MNRSKVLVSRGHALAAGGIAVLLSLLRPFTGTAQAQKAVLLAKQTLRVPPDPEDPLWNQAEALEVPLAPQAVVKPRRYEPGVPSLVARALYDENRLGVLLEWEDHEQDIGPGSVATFRDAVAIEFTILDKR